MEVSMIELKLMKMEELVKIMAEKDNNNEPIKYELLNMMSRIREMQVELSEIKEDLE